MALRREGFYQDRVIRSERLRNMKRGNQKTVAGIVTHRQRPGTASGLVFAILEDEAGITNVIIWSRFMEEQREAILGSQLMLVRGWLQSEQGFTSLCGKPWITAIYS